MFLMCVTQFNWLWKVTKKYAGELYISESGHLEFAYSASAGPALQKAFHAAPGEAFGFMAGSPAAIGLVMGSTLP